VCGHCDAAIAPLIVQMDGETIDSRVEPFLSALSHTSGVGWHLLGTDSVGQDVFAGLLYGGQRSLTIGLVAGISAVILGWIIGLWSVFSEFIRWPRISYWIGIGFIFGVLIYWRLYLLILLLAATLGAYARSEERRVGKEGRAG